MAQMKIATHYRQTFSCGASSSTVNRNFSLKVFLPLAFFPFLGAKNVSVRFLCFQLTSNNLLYLHGNFWPKFSPRLEKKGKQERRRVWIQRFYFTEHTSECFLRKNKIRIFRFGKIFQREYWKKWIKRNKFHSKFTFQLI